jgi:Zn-dependent M16 (insulinase) family peptidase
MNIDQLKAYELIEKNEIEDINAVGYLLKHKKSGARIMALSNNDENKVFNIAFRTPPGDSTGLPHILEHSVLCGSKKFPSKDPFVELVKGSLNTFLNAMTFPDKTMYPIASCNDKDFQNLMHVYMDAVFFTNIYEKEEIFRQEGWNYNLESEEDEITYNGVVYNEMKGAFSSPEGVLDREILNSLFPDTAYSHESGGDPQHIPDLKYSEFLSFHSKYYHPSNSFIYLYGDMDMTEKLNWLDEEYLKQYDAMEVHSEIKLQKPFAKTIEVKKQYSIADGETTEDNTYLSYNMVIGTSLDVKLSLAFQLLEYALLSAPGAPLKQALLDAKIGKDIMGSYDNGIYQPIFSIIAKNSNPELKETFLELIHNTLKDISEKGMDEKALLAGANYFEFKFREADYGSYPKGLMYSLETFNSWLYDDTKPFIHLEVLNYFKELREEIGTGYFEGLIEKYLLDNPHSSIVMIEPVKGLTAKLDKETQEKLREYKKSLSKVEIQELVEKTKRLIEFQEVPSTKEELEMIPMLHREDIKKEAPPIYNKEIKFGDVPGLHHEIFTNGIGYLNILFDTKDVPYELIPYMGLLKSVLGYVDTENYKYGDLFNQININTGGVHTSLTVYPNIKVPKEFSTKYEIKAKILYPQLGYAFSMIREILFESKLGDEKRLYEIVAQLKSRLQMSLNSSGHSSAATRSMSYFSPVSLFTDLTGGIAFYKFIEKIEQDFDHCKEEVIKNLQSLLIYIFRPENMMVSYTADKEGFQLLEQEVIQLSSLLHTEKIEKKPYKFKFEQLNEGYKTSSKIQYVARSGNFIDAGYTYHAALKILKVILSYEYLWKNVRVKGGAYGCMSGFNKLGDSYFVSYRDPNLEKTNEVFDKTAEYVKNFEVDDRDMTKYIIGTISDMDVPLNPSAKGARSLSIYLTNQSYEELQEERDQVLNADKKTIQNLSGLIEAVLSQNNLCVIGNEEKIEEQKELFKTVLQLVE